MHRKMKSRKKALRTRDTNLLVCLGYKARGGVDADTQLNAREPRGDPKRQSESSGHYLTVRG
jgi:hypothetical protein